MTFSSFRPLALVALFSCLTMTAAVAQTPAPATPVRIQGDTSTPPKTDTKPAAVKDTAEQHLAKARTALDGIALTTVSGPAATALTQLKERFGEMEKSFIDSGMTKMSSQEKTSGSTRVTITKTGNWSSHIGDVDRLVGELLGFPTAAGVKMEVAEPVKTQLRTFRTHLTNFALAADGTAGANAPKKP